MDAQGGWPAVVAGMDVMLLLAVAGARPARCLDADTYLYRSHPGQAHRSPLRFATRPQYRALARRMLASRPGHDGARPKPREKERDRADAGRGIGASAPVAAVEGVGDRRLVI